MYTVLLYDRLDVERFKAEGVAAQAREIRPLTPAAQAELGGVSVPVIAPEKAHSNLGQGRDVVRRARLVQLLESELESSSLSVAARQVVIDWATDACGISSRIWTMLRGADAWMIPLAEGKWLQTADRAEAHRALVQRFVKPYNDLPTLQTVLSTPEDIRTSLLTANARLCLRIAKSRPVFFNMFARGYTGFIKDLQDCDPEIWTVTFNPLHANEAVVSTVLAQLEAMEKGEPGNRQVTLTIPPKRMPEQAEAARRALSSVREPIAKAGIDVMLPFILANVEWMESIIVPFSVMMSFASARAVFCWDHADRLNTAMGEAARLSGVRSIVSCHTSVSPALDRMSLEAKGRRNRDLTCGPLADLAVVQSPHAEAVVRQLAPELPVARVRPFVWGRPASSVGSPIQKKANPRRTILHAANYFSWSEYLPWTFETSADYVEHLKHLVPALENVDARLIIRLKSNFARKGEVTPECLTTLIPQASRSEIREEGSFYHDLEEADLVVAFHSTTIEEALLSRRPVLLLGGMSRYLHIPAREALPTADDRAATYAVRDMSGLPQMLKSILDSHCGRPLTDAELEEHVWLREMSSIQLAKAMIDGDLRAMSERQ